jgi:photosystem II stability/assembly factor-like uncharacterized protein
MKNDKKFITGAVIVTVALLAWVWWNGRQSTETPAAVSNQDVEQKLYPEKEITHGHGLAIDVSDSTKVYIATHHGLLVLKDDNDLFRVGTSRDDYMGFSVHPTNPNIFFSSGHPSTGGNVGFQKSEDGGTTWEKISNGLGGPVDFHAMTVSPVNPDLAFGWYQGNLQRSEDGGKNWIKFSTPAPFVALAGDTKDENIVYAASPQGLFRSTDKGQSWDILADGFVAAISISPKDSQILLISSEKLGFAKSIDSGKNWQTIDQNFSGESPLFIDFDRQNPETLYFLSEKNSVYKSTDEGIVWNKIR